MVDSNYATNIDDRGSVTGAIFTVGGAIMNWSSLTQGCVTVDCVHHSLGKSRHLRYLWVKVIWFYQKLILTEEMRPQFWPGFLSFQLLFTLTDDGTFYICWHTRFTCSRYTYSYEEGMYQEYIAYHAYVHECASPSFRCHLLPSVPYCWCMIISHASTNR